MWKPLAYFHLGLSPYTENQFIDLQNALIKNSFGQATNFLQIIRYRQANLYKVNSPLGTNTQTENATTLCCRQMVAYLKKREKVNLSTTLKNKVNYANVCKNDQNAICRRCLVLATGSLNLNSHCKRKV